MPNIRQPRSGSLQYWPRKRAKRNGVRIRAKPKSKDATVKILEQRMKMKLDEVGLNSKMINEVLDYVLYNIEKIKDLPQPTQVAESTRPQQNLSSVHGRAEAILDDLMFSVPVVSENVGIGGSDPQPAMYSVGNLNLNKTNLFYSNLFFVNITAHFDCLLSFCFI